uniref:ATP synthase subunit a n=1 Tax=Dendropoma gregarium TaxID=169306 RepID=E2FLQ7_9CAEN|nr:ATP synthase F0 subunit 6 [Dendropoma gregarium]ADI79373.1 ATP synthase F0 subunit 6 [Dendropoma gregarium]
MLSDIFSCFDDKNQVVMSFYYLTWLLSLVALFLLGSNYWISTPSGIMSLNILSEVIYSQVGRSLGRGLDVFGLLLGTLFIALIFLNLSGMIPYVFSSSSHLLVSLSFGLPLWLSLVISGFSYGTSSAIAALLPAGAPAGLNPFLVLVETVSLVVRPITLSVRLAANMSAGHIVLGLVGTFFTSVVFLSYSVILLVVVQMLYSMFEFGICIIQSYILCLLLTLYSDEHPQ